jgi:UDPglucose--hexose-1-phosphate uridylyltransferase
MLVRFDPIRRRWIIFAPERSNRLDYFVMQKEQVDDPKYCPFCPENEIYTGGSLYESVGIIDGKKGWLLRVIPNKFPLLKVEEKGFLKQYGPYAYMDRLGAHEVIIETRVHSLKMADYDDDTFLRLIDAIIHRISDLRNDVRLKYITFVKNSSYLAGATMTHPHSQIIAFPFLPNDIRNIFSNMFDHYRINNRCLLCDIIDFELDKSERIICKNDSFIAFSPYASKHSFEIKIAPLFHRADFTKITDNERKMFVDILKNILIKINGALDNPAFNLNLVTVPYNHFQPDSDYFRFSDYFSHWFVEIFPRVNRIGGIEKGTGVYVNPFLPEKCTEILSTC